MRTIVLITALAATTAACSPKGAEPAPDARPAVPVRVARVDMSDAAARFEAGGVVRARTSAAITSRILAPVREMRVAAGDRVRAGQVLVVLDANDLSAAARGARASAAGAEQGSAAARAEQQAASSALDLARATHGRIAALHARQSATAQELDEAVAALAAAEGRAAAARARAAQAASAVDSAAAGRDAAAATASFAVITAPFAGLVTETMVDPGAMASPGMPLLQLDDTRAFRLEVQVDESRVHALAEGADVEVALDAGPSAAGGEAAATVVGRIDEIARAVSSDARAFTVKVALPDSGALRSGMFGRARFAGETRPALHVPDEALVRRGQVTSVFVVEDGIARLRLVSVRGTEVLAGLSAGETVVLSPPSTLADGQTVTVGSR